MQSVALSNFAVVTTSKYAPPVESVTPLGSDGALVVVLISTEPAVVTLPKVIVTAFVPVAASAARLFWTFGPVATSTLAAGAPAGVAVPVGHAVRTRATAMSAEVLKRRRSISLNPSPWIGQSVWPLVACSVSHAYPDPACGIRLGVRAATGKNRVAGTSTGRTSTSRRSAAAAGASRPAG